MFKASQHLVDILEVNGFKNKSYLYVPDYGERFSYQVPYDPGAYKRAYGFGKGKRKDELYFDYINMAVVHAGVYITESYIEWDECKLRSIIAYFKCSHQRQRTIRKYCNNRIELAGEQMQKQRRKGICSPPFDTDFEGLYDQAVIT